MYNNVYCGIQIKNADVYKVYKSSRFNRRFSKYKKLSTPKIRKAIFSAIQMLCDESDMDILKSRLSFHQLNNYTITVDGIKYRNPYDIHVPGGGTNNNNDLVILFDYDHDNKEVILLDIGSHNSLNINGSTDIDNELIWL
ncbi:MAG: hypothetical protein NC320_03125 [Clostridium sp.]|nr:hypothetical protein [Clostridium sp.]